MLLSITGMLSLMGLLKKGKSFLTDGKWKNLKDFLRSVKSDRRIQMVLQLGQDMLLTQNLPQERYFYKSSQRLQGPLSIPGLCTTVLLCTKLSLSYEVTHSTLLLFFFFWLLSQLVSSWRAEIKSFIFIKKSNSCIGQTLGTELCQGMDDFSKPRDQEGRTQCYQHMLDPLQTEVLGTGQNRAFSSCRQGTGAGPVPEQTRDGGDTAHNEPQGR